jgi:hypothetical protein
LRLSAGKGEAAHHLSRFLCFGKEGVLRGREFGDQVHTFSCLSVLHNAAVACKILHIESIVNQLRAEGKNCDDHILSLTTPLMRKHLNPFGRYYFDLNRMRLAYKVKFLNGGFRLIFRVPEYSLQRRRRIPPQGSPPTEATRFRISLALFFVQLLSQHLKELKAAGGDIVLVDEPGAVEEALRIIGDGSVHLGVDAIGGVAARKTLAVSRFLSDPFAQYLRLASCRCDFATC